MLSRRQRIVSLRPHEHLGRFKPEMHLTPSWPELIFSLPMAVYTAIVLFLIKELLEWTRRRRGNQQKLAVFKKILAYECERNNWFVKSLRDDCEKVRPCVGGYAVKTDGSGRHRLLLLRHDGSLHASRTLPAIHRANLEKMAVEVGHLDERLALLVVNALDAVLELDHIRSSLIDFATATEDYQQDDFYKGFWDYVKQRLNESHSTLSILYKACVGRELQEFKLL